jgi:alkanesulfonate monooxygenase SsuD/methylene tetrahydromethanopterin reductase-like flavin-dependent oxidoreductase (luciferase family)
MNFGVKPAEGDGRFREAVEQTRTAEEYGFETVFLSEHNGFPGGGYWPHPLLALAGLARETDRIELSTAVSLLPLTNPVELAGEIALLDVVSDGRATPGFGAGWREIEFEAFGVPFEERGARMTEYLDIVTSLLEPGPTTYDGEFFSFEAFELTPRPVQEPRPELLLGGVGKHALERAVEFGAGWISPSGDLDKLGYHAEQFRDGGVDRLIIQLEAAVVREDPEHAREAGKRFVRMQKKPLIEAENPHSGDDYGLAELESTLENSFEEYITERAILVGTPDECIEQLDRIESATGCEQVVCRVSNHSWPHDESLETLELLGEAVLPSF